MPEPIILPSCFSTGNPVEFAPMTDRDFFRNSARECRDMAARARNDHIKGQLLLWARQFEAIADERDLDMARRERQMAAAD